jgi:hypothetical protein
MEKLAQCDLRNCVLLGNSRRRSYTPGVTGYGGDPPGPMQRIK